MDDSALRSVGHGACSGAGRRAQTRHELGDYTVGELGPFHEELVEHDLVDPQDERRLEGGHRRRARRGHERGELADRGAGAELDERAVAAVHAYASLDDGVEVGLDRALLHQRLTGRHALLDGRFRDRREDATGNVGEHPDAVQRRDALDQTERPSRRRPGVRHRR